MRRYDEYRYSFWEVTGVLSIYLLILASVAFFFYNSLIFFFISLLTVPFYLKYQKRRLLLKQKEKLTEEFAEVLYSVNANVKAGFALENAFLEARKDILLFYGETSIMAQELTHLKKCLSINKTLESVLIDLGDRSGVEDIRIFAKVFETAKRNGGNIRQVLETTADTVKAKSEVEREIQVLITQKKLELRIMEVVPFFIIAYIGLTSKGYFDVLYHNLKGIIFMTACLLLYGFSIYLGSKLVKINV